MFTYKVAWMDGKGPDLPEGVSFASICNGGPTVIVKTLEEVPGLTPLTREEAEVEVKAMGFDPGALDRCALGGEA